MCKILTLPFALHIALRGAICYFNIISRFKHLSKSKMAESPCLWELQPLLFSKVCCTETLSRNFFDLFIQLLRLVILPV